MRIAILAALLTVCSCSSEPAKPAGAPAGAGAQQTPANPPAAGAATLTVTGNDMMQFDQKQLEVKVGQQVKVTFKNVGSLPKAAMGHNFVVLRKGVTLEQFTPKVMAPKGTPENDYLPADAKGDVLAATKILGPGESETIEFTAPGMAGELVYVCTFPGHFAVMNGKILVK